jgi:hypothetical protein
MARNGYPQRNNTRYPLERRFCGFQSRFGCFGEDRNLLLVVEIKLLCGTLLTVIEKEIRKMETAFWIMIIVI